MDSMPTSLLPECCGRCVRLHSRGSSGKPRRAWLPTWSKMYAISLPVDTRSALPACCIYKANDLVALSMNIPATAGMLTPSEMIPTFEITLIAPESKSDIVFRRNSWGVVPSRCAAAMPAWTNSCATSFGVLN